MGFDRGSVSFRMYYVPEGLPANAVERFAGDAAPPLDTLSGDDVIQGWVGHRHLLDRAITDENAMLGGYLFVSLMKAERKIPPALLRAECRLEELAHMQADGVSFLKRQAKSEIKKSVQERLLPEMPPTLTGMEITYANHEQILYTGAVSDKQHDALDIAFRQTMGVSLYAVGPESAAMKLRHLDTREILPTSFSPEIEDELSAGTIGSDFLTWLWFYSEARGGVLTTPSGEFAVGLDGPIVFVHEGGGAHETVLRKGNPLLSAEAKIALLNGKKLKQAKVMLARDDQAWHCTIDADTFVVRSLKLPESDAFDPASHFQERMLHLESFRSAWLAFYDRFLGERADRSAWAETQRDIHKWVQDRAAKA